MTFYNIIFGILFVAACRQLLCLADSNLGWTAATVALIVFNDTLHTSQLLEGDEGLEYKLSMKYLDLVAFMLLSLALIALDPADNPFAPKLAPTISGWLSKTWTVWALLAGYWTIAWFWNLAAGLTSPMKWNNAAHSGPIVFAAAFIAVAILAGVGWARGEFPVPLRIAMFGGTAAYLVGAKLLLKRGTI
jgi:hypothetical protein